MKKTILTGISLILALLVPVTVFAAPKKKSGKTEKSEISCADVWAQKSEELKGKPVKTYVLDIFEAGTLMSDAPAAVVSIETGGGNKSSGGLIYVLMPVGEFGAFVEKFLPDSGNADSSFGGKAEFKLLSAEFDIVGGEDVLRYKIKADTLKKFSPSEALEIQRNGENAMKSERDGFEKKIFNVSKISKKKSAEFKRLVGLYNQGKKKADRLKEKELREQCLDDDEFSVTVFDEKAKIEWLIRR